MNEPDYWDLATLSELKVIEGDIPKANEYLSQAIVHIPDEEVWMLETTLNNFILIQEARETRGEDVTELKNLINELKKDGLK